MDFVWLVTVNPVVFLQPVTNGDHGEGEYLFWQMQRVMQRLGTAFVRINPHPTSAKPFLGDLQQDILHAGRKVLYPKPVFLSRDL